MDNDADLGWRPISAEQVRAWAALIAAIESADRVDEHLDEHDLLEELTDPDIDYVNGSVAVYDGDLIVGYGICQPRSTADPVHEMRLDGGVHPLHRGRGIGTRLLDWAEQAAVPLHRQRFCDQPLSLAVRCLARNTGAGELFSARGYRRSRWFHRMSSDLSQQLAECPPGGVEVVGFTPERSQDARMVRNEAFRDHWGSAELTEDSWAHSLGYEAFMPEFSFLAYAGARPLGLVIGHEYDSYTRATGRRDLYIAVVGTRREGRKRGIATALLARALNAARSDGFVAATLDVDADSPTGAFGLYQRLGFVVTDTWISHTKAILPADLPAG